jgi:hypothetical protein
MGCLIYNLDIRCRIELRKELKEAYLDKINNNSNKSRVITSGDVEKNKKIEKRSYIFLILSITLLTVYFAVLIFTH